MNPLFLLLLLLIGLLLVALSYLNYYDSSSYYFDLESEAFIVVALKNKKIAEQHQPSSSLLQQNKRRELSTNSTGGGLRELRETTDVQHHNSYHHDVQPPTNNNNNNFMIPITSSTIQSLPRSDASESSLLVQTTFLKDDFSIGKSCKKAAGKGWECRDCGLMAKNYTTNHHGIDWNNHCPLIAPHGICKTLTTWDWDPRQASGQHDPLDPSSGTGAHRHVIYHYGMADHASEQVPCDVLEDCWDMSKCVVSGAAEDQPLAVFGYGDYAIALIQQAVTLHPNALRYEPDPEAACLLLATRESFETPSHMQDQVYWNGGKNHFLWGADSYFGSNPDRPLNIYANFDHASLSTAAFSDAAIRLGYDIPQATMRMTSPEFQYHPRADDPRSFMPHTNPAAKNDKRKRPILLNFKGNIFRMPQVYWHHRYLAVEYWDRGNDVFCDVVCKKRGRGTGKQQYVTPREAYAELLLNTTFAYCPGGGSVGSYRFAEALGLGAIPVVTSEFVPPLAPEVDWSGCLVQVSEARIIDIPRIVREISENGEQLAARQERCRYLFETIIGWSSPDPGDGGQSLDRNRSLPLSLLIWRERIQAHFRFKQQGESLLHMMTSTTNSNSSSS